jgi:hypothetical protein
VVATDVRQETASDDKGGSTVSEGAKQGNVAIVEKEKRF